MRHLPCQCFEGISSFQQLSRIGCVEISSEFGNHPGRRESNPREAGCRGRRRRELHKLIVLEQLIVLEHIFEDKGCFEVPGTHRRARRIQFAAHPSSLVDFYRLRLIHTQE